MFLVIVQNIPPGYQFYESNKQNFSSLKSFFSVPQSQIEILLFSEYEAALDVVLRFDRAPVWDTYCNKMNYLSVKKMSLCIGQQREE